MPPPALIRAGLDALPALVRAEGERTSRRFIEFFSATIRNRNTGAAYARAVKQLLDWCENRGLELHDIEAVTVVLVACLKPVPAYWQGAAVLENIAAGMKAMARFDSSSIYPAVQNIILACRAFGLGTVLTTLHAVLEDEFKAVLEIPREVDTWALLPIGYPLDNFGPVKRKPISEVACLDRWTNPWPG